MRNMLVIGFVLSALTYASIVAPVASASPPTCESSPGNDHNVFGYVDCVQQCANGETFQVWPLRPVDCP